MDSRVYDALDRVYRLNEEAKDGSLVYAFPFDENLTERIFSAYKEYIDYIFVPKPETSETDICPYLIARTNTDEGGYLLLVFTAGMETEKLINAVRNVMDGKDPDGEELKEEDMLRHESEETQADSVHR